MNGSTWGAIAPLKKALFAGLSVGGHVALAAALTAGASAHPAKTGVATTEIEVALEAPVPPPPEVPEPAPAAPERPLANRAPAIPHPHTHDYPVPTDHAAHDHDPSLRHAREPTEPAEPPAAVATSEAPATPRFTIKLDPSAHDHTGGLTGAPALASVQAEAPATVVEERDVSEPARLVSRAAVAYPAGASEEELEADVLLEIVVDTNGAVVEARPLRRAGHGFDEAALAAIRGYRFSPAKKSGNLVRVRMRWPVQFRMR